MIGYFRDLIRVSDPLTCGPGGRMAAAVREREDDPTTVLASGMVTAVPSQGSQKA